MNPVTFYKPRGAGAVILAMRDGKILAKLTRYTGFGRGTWLVQSHAGLDLGGKSGHPGVRGFYKLADAKRAILAAASSKEPA
ncbi:MAG: hypothetical protein J2P48_17620 [Alphaproteobacteria bacterium]|nr:hypothetical protein [Alphaproteobacteria bacterium]